MSSLLSYDYNDKSPYKLSTKILKPNFKVLSKTWLSSKAAKQHPNYPTKPWDKHPSYRLHVKIRHSSDQTYIVSFIDDNYEDNNNNNNYNGNGRVGTVQQLVTHELRAVVGPKEDVVHMDPDTPFKTVQTGEFGKRVDRLLGVGGGSEVVEDVMEYCRRVCNCRSNSVDDHLFLEVEFCVQEVYVCFEGVADNFMII